MRGGDMTCYTTFLLNAVLQVEMAKVSYWLEYLCVDHNKLWKILKEIGIPDHLTCLLRNLYAGQEASYDWTWNNGLV